jgi:ABC-type transporter Mla subunit MlaD
MSETGRNFWVGMFVIVSVIVLATLMAWFGETPEWLGGNEWTLRITSVKDLAGIEAGTPVRLNGVEIGRVQALEFVDPVRPDLGVNIVARIKDQYAVPEGAVARVYGATFGFGTGRVDVIVDPRMAFRPLDKETAEIRGEMRNVISEYVTPEMVSAIQGTFENVGRFAGAWTPVAENLAALLATRSVAEVTAPGSDITPNIATVVERLDIFIANLNDVLGDETVQGDVKGAVHDLKASAQELQRMIEQWRADTTKLADNLNAGIDRTEENLDRSFGNLNEVLEHIDEGATGFAQALQEIAKGRGTAGRMVRDERLYEAAVLSVQRFGEAMSTLDRVLKQIEAQGYFRIGSPASGPLTKKFSLPAQNP